MRIGASLVLLRQIGEGGMGQVWLAQDELLDRQVAVKWLRADSDLEALALRTLLEARAAARVVHPHVVAVHAIGDDQGLPYIEMEWVDGPSLRRVLANGAVPRPQAALWLVQIAAALDAAHRLGVIHCDIKPENVLLRTLSDGPTIAKLADFGLARSRQDGRADAPLSHGTAAYLAPELETSAPRATSDLFALAVMAVELLTGDLPERPDWRTQPQIIADQLPPAARDVLRRATDANPQRRPTSAGAFADELLRALGLASLRSGLPSADFNATSAEIALPVLGGQVPLEVAIPLLLSVLPPQTGLLDLALGSRPPADLLAQLRHDGTLIGTNAAPELAPEMDRHNLTQSLPPRALRVVLARAASAIEAGCAQSESSREDATRLYLAARRLGDAARLARESAAATANARARRQHLSRVVALSASATQAGPWLAALLDGIEWDLRCGWLEAVRAPLAEAQGLAADLALAPGDPLRLRADLADAALRLGHGHPRKALERLDRVAAAMPAEAAEHPLGPEVWALRVAALAEGERPELALAQARAGSGGQAIEPAVQASLAAAWAAMRLNDWNSAERFALQATAGAAELGDALLAAEAALRRGECELGRGRPTRARKLADDALALLESLGTVATTAKALWLAGRCCEPLRQPLAAARAYGQAEVLAGEMGLPRLRLDALLALAELAQTAGQGDVAEAWRQEAARLRRRMV